MRIYLFYVRSICNRDTGLCLDRVPYPVIIFDYREILSCRTSLNVTSLLGGGGIIVEEDNIITPRARSFMVQISPCSSA